jgi:NADH dehydrogenase
LFHGVDAVVNLAGIKREEGTQTFEAVHVQLVRNLVASMKSAGVRRLIHISVVVARSSPDLPYHDSKWRGEDIVKASGLDYTILRPGVIYGEGDDMLAHLSLMIRSAPIFPIVGNGSSPMRPVDVRDVAAAVIAALQKPCPGSVYEIVGPDRMNLQNVVRTVAAGLNLPVWICPTPLALMRVPVRIMEAVMEQPLSTRAQLEMLVEGLDGDPAAAKRDLGLSTAPFTAAHIQPILAKTNRAVPLSLRLFSALPSAKEITILQFWMLLLLTLTSLAIALGAVRDRWMGMTVAMGIAFAGTLLLPSIRRHLKPTPFRFLTGLIGGVVLYGITLLAVRLLPVLWPGWEGSARTLYSWKVGHSPIFIALTLILIVTAEEMLWRGVVTRYLIEHCGRTPGIICGSAIYALAHWAAFNPLLLIAAFGCGFFWSWLYAATDDLVAPTASHLLWDLLLLFLFPVVR